MKRWLSEFTIRGKLVVILTLASSVTLLLAFALVVVTDLSRYRIDAMSDLAGFASVIGSNSAAAVVFRDVAGAERAFAGLRSQPAIIGAAIYDNQGVRIATYGQTFTLAPNDLAPRLFGKVFGTSQPIRLDAEVVGRIELLADQSVMWRSVTTHLSTMLIGLLIAALFALLLSLRLQRLVSEPLSELATRMRDVASQGRYETRMQVQSKDEIGTLVESFNLMLEQVQSRDQQLAGSRDRLEQQVAARTRDLIAAKE